MRQRKLYPSGASAEMRFMEVPVELLEARAAVVACKGVN